MGNLQYVGPRVVPKPYKNPDTGNAEWKSDVEYEALIMVTYMSKGYVSAKPVPSSVGDPESNPEYWVESADFDAALSALQEDVQELQEKVTPEGFTETFNEVSDDLAVNKWWPDNDRENAAGVGLNELTFNEISAQFFNAKRDLVVEEWVPFNDDNEFNIHPKLNVTAGSTTFLKKGVKVVSPDTNLTHCNINKILSNIKANMCVRFRTFANKGNTTHRCRCGISFNGRCTIYMENGTKKINYEIDSSSWVPTALNNDITFEDADYLDFMCFVQWYNISVYVSADGGPYQYIGTTPNSTGTLPGDVRTSIQLNGPCIGELTDVQAVYTFIALSDCKYIHYDDTTPYIQDGKAYLTATLQAYGCNMTGILRHTLGFNDLELVGVISSNADESALGTDMCFDRKNKRFITLFRNDKLGGGNKIGYAISHTNNLNGRMVFITTDLPTAASSTDFGNYSSDEDPAVCFFKGHWYIAINRIHTSPYIYEVFKSSGEAFDLTSFEHLCTVSSASLTGASFIQFNNELYLVAGNGNEITVFNANSGVSVGSLGVSVANRVWGNITIINRGNESKCYLTTFDRNKVTTGNWSYGAIHMFESTDDIPELVVPNTYTW